MIKKSRKRISNQDKIVDIVIIIMLLIVAFVSIYPIWFVIIASFSDPTYISSGKVLLWPKGFNLNGYTKLVEHPDLWLGYRNSIFYLFAGSFISLITILPAAYALSRKELAGRKFLNFFFVATMYFSGGLIPSYLLNTWIGWRDTVWVMLIPTAVKVYYLILARSSFASIPEAMHESAQIDGASEFRYFFQFVIPLSKATIAVLFLFEGLDWWNQYMRFIIYIDNPKLQSLQVIVRQITTSITSALSDTASSAEVALAQQQTQLLRYSIVVIVALPFIIIYPFVQKFFNKGVMIGAVKG